ncbi:MAG: hypothetical protein IT379_37950 [Deltaproteobacteria bacterium]|nr:hypothetical protein [Deltaproteobacteria bacterium]
MQRIYLSVGFGGDISRFGTDPQIRLYGSIDSPRAVAFHVNSAAATGHVVRQVSRLAEAAAVRSWSFHTRELAAPGTDWKNFDELVAAELKADETVPSANSLKDPDYVELPPQAAQRPRGSVCGIAGTTAYSAKLLALLPGATSDRRGPVIYKGEPVPGWFTFTPAAEESVLDPSCVRESKDARGEEYWRTLGVWYALADASMPVPVVVDTLESGPARRNRHVLVERALADKLVRHVGKIALLPVFRHDSETARVVREIDAVLSALPRSEGATS